MNITALTSHSFIIFVIYFLASCYDIYDRSRTNTCIQISINFIDSDWINDIYRDLFGPQVIKVKYILIIDMDCFQE